MNSFKILGLVFIVTSGFIYTLEKGFSMLSSSIVQAGFYSGGMTGEVPEIEVSGFFENLYVVPLLVLGILILLVGFVRDK
ncbi:hypothetical protein CSV61_07915 [Sporosarcina sp. P3]|uniref:hypothetical protein n=1 Tax=Sporosarcina sp. P3 TaxID=2048245 RepID=UPI000C16DFE3|nr:hypothetical protein [Sporosarcina sp. P3]PID21621.1 hypothetical protein CSV61_07915 [Sporosarcina sp. P3]